MQNNTKNHKQTFSYCKILAGCTQQEMYNLFSVISEEITLMGQVFFMSNFTEPQIILAEIDIFRTVFFFFNNKKFYIHTGII